MNAFRTIFAVAPVALAIALTGCDDPVKDLPKATVSSAKPAATGASTGAATGATTAAAPASEAVTVDVAASSVGFVGAKVTGSHPGTFKEFTASITLANGKAEGGSVKVEISMASVKSDSDKLDEHLKSPDFFDVAKFAKATFASTEIKAGGDKGASHTITGELELHGVKKTISFPATITISADGVNASAEFAINRKDFKIEYPGKKDDLIKDDVAIKLTIKGARKK